MGFLPRTDIRIDAITTAIRDDRASAAVNAQFDVWNTSAAAPLVLSYQFENTAPADMWWQFSGWSAWTAAQEAAIRSVLDEYETIINVKFVRNDTLADPDINFGRVNLPTGTDGQGAWSFAYATAAGDRVTSKTMDSFAVFKNTVDLTAASSRSLILHEFGHAMTLEHPGPYDVGGMIPGGTHLPIDQDSNRYTVMSYTENPDNGRDSDHLMLYDIAALQARWGANMTYRTGADTYTGPNGLVQTIWDAGGIDKIDGSGKAQAVTIDLREGTYSSLGAVNNLSIAFGAVIENATGSAFGDTLIGNDVANVLTGGGGNDTIEGGLGIDTAVFSGARSQYKVTQLSATSVRVEDLRAGTPDGMDTIANVEQFQFTDGLASFSDLVTMPVAGSVAIGDVIITEGNVGTKLATFVVNRSGGTAAFNVNFATSNGTATTADGDYVAVTNGLLQFAAGETSKTISITINGDTKVEASETFNVLLSGATNGATISDAQGVGTISNDDTAPVAGSVAIGDVIITEGNAGTKLATFVVNRTGGTAAFNVNFATSNGTATTADGDYVAITNGLLQFAANETSKTISVTINGDTKVEASETFNVLLSGATNGATISDAQGVGTISNDDTAPVAGSVAIGDVIITEGNAGTKLATFVVNRTGGTAAFNVNFGTSNGTATTADGDYVGITNGLLQFAANETSKTISVTINGDTKVEASETFNVLLSGATNGATISDAQGVGTISNDDTAPVAGSVAIGDVIITEGNAGTKLATFVVNRTGGTAAFDVNFATSNGTATTADGDYAANNGILQFGANETSKTISVVINGDLKVEASETFNVLLSNATNGATISDGQGVGTISNDDTAVNKAPVATIADHSLATNEWSTVSGWISYSDAENQAATQYQFWDGGAGANSGYFWTPSNAHHAAETAITVNAADLGNVWVRGGASAGTETMWVRAFDGQQWGEWDSFNFTTTGNHAPEVTVYNQTVSTNEWSQAYWFMDYIDPDGDQITAFKFWDGGTGADSGYFWTPDNAHHAAATEITVAAADLESVWYRGGQTAGTETLWVQAYDGEVWSEWKPMNVTTDPLLYL